MSITPRKETGSLRYDARRRGFDVQGMPSSVHRTPSKRSRSFAEPMGASVESPSKKPRSNNYISPNKPASMSYHTTYPREMEYAQGIYQEIYPLWLCLYRGHDVNGQPCHAKFDTKYELQNHINFHAGQEERLIEEGLIRPLQAFAIPFSDITNKYICCLGNCEHFKIFRKACQDEYPAVEIDARTELHMWQYHEQIMMQARSYTYPECETLSFNSRI